MGQKSNPIALRLNLNRSHDSLWFSDVSYSKNICLDLKIRKYISDQTQSLLERKQTKRSKPLMGHKNNPSNTGFHRKRKRKRKASSLCILFSRVFVQILSQKIRIFPIIVRVRRRRKNKRKGKYYQRNLRLRKQTKVVKGNQRNASHLGKSLKKKSQVLSGLAKSFDSSSSSTFKSNSKLNLASLPKTLKPRIFTKSKPRTHSSKALPSQVQKKALCISKILKTQRKKLKHSDISFQVSV